jgi:hypothetical protein
MRRMDCKRMTRMMSLYVAGDLVGEPEREAAAHLAACQACRQLAEEFSESSSLLTQACAQPQFDAEFYNGIRSAVLGKIALDRIGSKPSIFGRLWGRRWVYAASFAALIVAVVALQLFRGTSREPRNVALTPPATHATASDQTKQNSSSVRQFSAPAHESDRAATQTRHPHKLFARLDSRRGDSQIKAARKPEGLNAAETARDNRKESAPVTLLSVASVAPRASPEISRIEIQTADPNIRIIWLAPRESQKLDQNNHSQDPENGDRN